MVPRVLLTIVALWLTIVPPLVDFTSSHVFHPEWTGHAKLHMVWLLGVNSGLGLLCLYLLWSSGPYEALRMRLANLLCVMILGAFFLAAFTRGLYDGTMTDVGGVAELAPGVDANAAVFAVMLVLSVVAFWKSPRPAD